MTDKDRLEKQAIVKAAYEANCLVHSRNYAATIDEDAVVHVVSNGGHFSVEFPMDYVADDVGYTWDNGIVRGVIQDE